jgi:hypothetical protein
MTMRGASARVKPELRASCFFRPFGLQGGTAVVPEAHTDMWHFLAVGSIGYRNWRWVHYAASGKPARSSRRDFPGISDAMADACLNGFERSADRWEIITGTGVTSAPRPGTPRRTR